MKRAHKGSFFLSKFLFRSGYYSVNIKKEDTGSWDYQV
jgi:hypothetical protein